MYGDRGRGRHNPRGGQHSRAPPPHRFFTTQNNRNARFHVPHNQNYRPRPPRFSNVNRDENWQYAEQYDEYAGYQPGRGRRYGANYQPEPLQTYFYTSGVAQPSPEIVSFKVVDES